MKLGIRERDLSPDSDGNALPGLGGVSVVAVYSVWLQKILDAHVRKTWDGERSCFEEEEDERFNDLWRDLDEHQQERLWGLSSDLNTLRDKETWVDADWRPMTEPDLARDQAEAFVKKDWDRLLTSLRRPPRFLPRSVVDYMRGRAWMELRHPEVAVLFFDNAARLDSGNAICLALALECLKLMSDWDELIRRAGVYLNDEKSPARLLFRVADALYVCATANAASALHQQAIKAVDRGFKQLGSEGAQEPLVAAVAAAFVTKALSLQGLGRFDDALAVFDSAVVRLPENATLLAARGLLKQQLDRPGAAEDFQRAVEMGAPVVWPYIELARAALQLRQWQVAVHYCQLGLERSRRSSASASLLDMLTIARYEDGDSIESVRRDFETALELDPLSEQIRSHCDAFRDGSGVNGDRHWQIHPKAPADALADVYSDLTPTV